MRSLWKGAISFGLIFIPVELFPADKEGRLDLDLLDRRDMAPVGYQRINKRTGKPVERGDVVKGYEYEEGRYVLLSDEEIRAANPKKAHTIDLLAFVAAEEIPLPYFEKPYSLQPGKGGEKVYVLLQEALRKSGRIGIAEIVLRSRQYLAAIVAEPEGLLLITLRYAHELALFEAGSARSARSVGLAAKEITMAENLIDSMTEAWNPAAYRDTFHDDLLKLVETKVKGRETHAVAVAEEGDIPPPPSNVVDLVALLRKSVGGGAREKTRRPARKAAAGNKPAPTKVAGTKAASTKAAARRKKA
ncbi:MAG TPA: Ku protein [Moraxellaceae bacterium]